MTNSKTRTRQQIDALVEEFKKKIVRHKRMVDAEEALISILSGYRNKPIVYVTGPTGVGKSRLLQICMKRLMKLEEAAIKADPGYIPVALIELANPERGVFDWVGFYRDILAALNEPLIEQKRLLYTDPKLRLLMDDLQVKPKSLPVYRGAADSAIEHRKLRTLLLDEAQHLLRVAGGRALKGQLDMIKTRAASTGVIHVLSGPYELLDGLDLSGQLSRRRNLVHISRYDPTDKDDHDQFAAALDTLASDLPIPLPASFQDNLDHVFAKTLGCVGVLKDWLVDCLYMALEQGHDRITTKIIEDRALSNKQLMIMLEEARQGEAALRGPSNDVLLKELGLPRKSPDDDEVKGADKGVRHRHPGERNPVRDPVGILANAA